MEQDMAVHLRWNNHQTTLLSVFSSLLNNGNLVDCTISAEGQYFKTHRVILSACSPYFELLFSQHYEMHPVVILPDVKFQTLKALMEFMYSGQVKVPQDKLCAILKLAEALRIKGLAYAGDSEMEDKLTAKRRSESPALDVQRGFKKRQHRPTHCSKMVHEVDGCSSNAVEKEYPEEASYLLPTQKGDKDTSNSTTAEKAVSHNISDSKAFNVFQCSDFTQTHTKSSSCVSETLLNTFSNILDSNKLSSSSKDSVRQLGMSADNVLPAHSSGGDLMTLEPVGTCGNRRVVDLLPDIKQEDPDELNGDSVEEIILDDDIEASDDQDAGSGQDKRNYVRELVRVIPEESVSGQSYCRTEQCRETYFVEPTSVLPNRFRCDACGRSYRYFKDLSRHWNYECGKEPQFKCLHCPARYTQKHNLRTHMEKMHLSY